MAIRTVIFDAYGTLFDVAAAARMAKDWRRKPLEFAWRQGAMVAAYNQGVA